MVWLLGAPTRMSRINSFSDKAADAIWSLISSSKASVPGDSRSQMLPLRIVSTDCYRRILIRAVWSPFFLGAVMKGRVDPTSPFFSLERCPDAFQIRLCIPFSDLRVWSWRSAVWIETPAMCMILTVSSRSVNEADSLSHCKSRHHWKPNGYPIGW